MDAKLVAGNDVLARLTVVLEDFVQDWGVDLAGGITRETRLLADLGFESIDVIQLVVAIEEAFGTRKLPFEALLMAGGRYVDDLSVGRIADFVSGHLPQ